MSWLFGIKRDPMPDMSSLEIGGTGDSGQPAPPKDGEGSSSGGSSSGGSSSGGSSGDDDGRSGAYRFDSTALERAAKAARELELSPHAKSILQLTHTQEETKKLEQLTKAKEFEAHIENAKSEQIRINHEERRKTIAEETKHNQQRAQYQDQLARKRHDEELAKQQRAHEERLQREEQSVAKQEALKRATFEKELERQEKLDIKRIEAKVRARGQVDRENQSLILEQIRTKAAEERTTSLERLKSIGGAFNELISDRGKLTNTIGSLVVLTAGFYLAKNSARVIIKNIDARLNRPSIVKEFHGFTFMDFLKYPIKTIKRLTAKSTDTLQGVVLDPKLEEHLSMFALATANAKKNKGYYMNMLLYGPPGTGKTLFARRLAQQCGMNCAIMSGADVVPLGKKGVSEIHRLFDYASTYRRGLLVFIDEADAFFRKRNVEHIGEHLRASLNAFLARTSDVSDKFMVVLASNVPEQIDEAVNDRIHAVVEFALPGLEERERLVRQYFDQYILVPATTGKWKFKVEKFDYSGVCSEIAKLTTNFSGRAISQMLQIMQAKTLVSVDGILTKKMVMDITERMVKEHKQKEEWRADFETKKWTSNLPQESKKTQSDDSEPRTNSQ